MLYIHPHAHTHLYTSRSPKTPTRFYRSHFTSQPMFYSNSFKGFNHVSIHPSSLGAIGYWEAHREPKDFFRRESQRFMFSRVLQRIGHRRDLEYHKSSGSSNAVSKELDLLYPSHSPNHPIPSATSTSFAYSMCLFQMPNHAPSRPHYNTIAHVIDVRARVVAFGIARMRAWWQDPSIRW